ncbi:hypothetical protein BDY19DRAFT_439732 [Irpex rosettiformis]|uniref:Uncharacterized protein n=1 Tax=Irpex rosettiformis TaxID=378272 RepID=A0ACB8TU17_9APHY|nr:hypothetical protein BDY19DRAFT_439732 [Irpex rosettiformis]
MQARQAEDEERLKAKIDYIRKRFKPVEFLPYDCHPMLHAVPKLAYYGIAVTTDELLKFATENKLYPNFKDKTDATCRLWALDSAVKLLSVSVKFPLELRMPLNPDFEWNIALYSNYVVEDERLIEEDEETVVNWLLDTLKLPTSRIPVWHYDFFDGNLEMRCSPWTPPSEEIVKRMDAFYKAREHLL